MSSFYDSWFSIARTCAVKQIDPVLACTMHRKHLQQAKAYYEWVSKKNKGIPSDPINLKGAIVKTYADQLEKELGMVFERKSLYAWANAVLNRLEQLETQDLYGDDIGPWIPWADNTLWGLFGLVVIQALHDLGHHVAKKTHYSDNPYEFNHRIPNFVDAKQWCRDQGFRTK